MIEDGDITIGQPFAGLGSALLTVFFLRCLTHCSFRLAVGITFKVEEASLYLFA